MKRGLTLVASLLVLAITAGCAHGQLPVTPAYEVVWTWTAPTSNGSWPGCATAAPCTYAVSTLSVSTGTASCPVSTGTNYAPQQTATTGVASATWTETGTSGLTMCAVVQTIQGGATSPASAASKPVASPALPLAPSAPSGGSQVASATLLPVPSDASEPQLASNATPTGIVGKVVRIR